jgi:hypothetical protein
VWKACSGNITEGQQIVSQNATLYADSVYQHTSYDDAYAPACTCLYDHAAGTYWAQCALGDVTADCSGKEPEENCVQTRTHEFFLFSAVSGGLAQKSSCTMCVDPSECPSDADGNPRETCTLVLFDDHTGEPLRCVFQRLLDDGSKERCDRCQICRENGATGIAHSCDSDSTGTEPTNAKCDLTETAQQHNFLAPRTIDRDTPRTRIGGDFGSLCQSQQLPEEEALYGSSTIRYDDEYHTKCECPDPTQGLVVCDLYTLTTATTPYINTTNNSSSSSSNTRNCFANECTELSETFLFDDRGHLFQKTTCDYIHPSNNNSNTTSNTTNSATSLHICSTVVFSQVGVPIACQFLNHHDAATATATTVEQLCDTCRICRDENGTHGLLYTDCEGRSESTACRTDQGRAVFNLPEPFNLPVAPPRDPFVEEPTRGVTTQRPAQRDTNYPTRLVLGIVLGGLAVVLSITVLWVIVPLGWSRPNSARTNSNSSGALASEREDSEPPTVLVDQTGEPMVDDPTPIAIA